MKKIAYLIILAIMCTAFTSMAQTKEEKQSRKQLEKIQKQREDSIDYVNAERAIHNMKFAMMAERLEWRNAPVNYVQENMNFFATDSVNAMLQVVPFAAGFQGINLKGKLTKSSVRKLKNGDTEIVVDIFGSVLNARIMIVMYKNSNNARATILPNFRRSDLTMYGKIFPIDIFNQLEDALKR